MQLRKSTYDDVESVCRIIAQAQSQMRRLGIDQWQNGYPDRNSVLADVEAGAGYVMCEADTVIACGAVIFGTDPNYAHIEEGEWITDGSDYVVVHRLAVADGFKHRGMATRFMRQVEEMARMRGTGSFRIDTHRDNLYMQSMLDTLGFTCCGVIYVSDGTPRRAYEKVLR
ncbi:MAG TPA: GNAT family N-acetyltransferase [Candidatus Alistipes excrementipullorum]|nr:GNAT family N-acetyltransferase [Candidatus Alistipes excrementipullorum]